MAKRNLVNIERYNRSAEAEVTSDAAALSLEHRVSPLAVSGTDAHTLAAPKWAGQEKYIYTKSAASTPVCTVAVASCAGASGAPATRTFAGFGTISASAPKALTLRSHDGLTWTIESMVGVTVS